MRKALPITAVLTVSLCVLPPAPSALAHHGWEEFQTTRPLYVAGTVEQVRWGNPHPEVRLRLTRPVHLPPGLATRAIPGELEEIGGRDVLRATRAFDGSADELTLILAPLERLSAWGMPDRVRDGERLEVVGYLHRDEEAELRPELVVRQDGRAIRQRSVPLPDAPSGADTPSNGGTSNGGTASSSEADGTASATVWVLGALAVLAVTGGGVLLARRVRRG